MDAALWTVLPGPFPGAGTGSCSQTTMGSRGRHQEHRTWSAFSYLTRPATESPTGLARWRMGILPSLQRHFDDQYSPRIAGSAVNRSCPRFSRKPWSDLRVVLRTRLRSSRGTRCSGTSNSSRLGHCEPQGHRLAYPTSWNTAGLGRGIAIGFEDSQLLDQSRTPK